MHFFFQFYTEFQDSRFTVPEINAFLHFTQKFKMAAINGGKAILCNVATTLCRYPVGQNFHRNRSISHRFQDKCIFVFYAKIQDGCQKWRKSNFLGKVTSRLCMYSAGKKFRQNRSISHHFQDKCAFAFYAKIQLGH